MGQRWGHGRGHTNPRHCRQNSQDGRHRIAGLANTTWQHFYINNSRYFKNIRRIAKSGVLRFPNLTKGGGGGLLKPHVLGNRVVWWVVEGLGSISKCTTIYQKEFEFRQLCNSKEGSACKQEGRGKEGIKACERWISCHFTTFILSWISLIAVNLIV